MEVRLSTILGRRVGLGCFSFLDLLIAKILIFVVWCISHLFFRNVFIYGWSTKLQIFYFEHFYSRRTSTKALELKYSFIIKYTLVFVFIHLFTESAYLVNIIRMYYTPSYFVEQFTPIILNLTDVSVYGYTLYSWLKWIKFLLQRISCAFLR